MIALAGWKIVEQKEMFCAMLLRLVYCVTSLDDFISCCSVCVRYEGWNLEGRSVLWESRAEWRILLALMIVFLPLLTLLHSQPHTLFTIHCRHSEKAKLFSTFTLFYVNLVFSFFFFWISKRIFLCISIHCSAAIEKAGKWIRIFFIDFFNLLFRSLFSAAIAERKAADSVWLAGRQQ